MGRGIDMSEKITKEEALDMFLEQCRIIANFWINDTRVKTDRDKVEGAIFSIMSMLDGCSGGFPAAIDLVLRPHPDDKQYCIDNDEDWIVDGQTINGDVHLHEIIFKKVKEE